jgi:hypothetical protein
MKTFTSKGVSRPPSTATTSGPSPCGKKKSWSGRSLNVFGLLQTLGSAAQVLKVELLDATFRYDLPRFDQTLTPIGESAIEFVIRKRLESELAAGGRLPNTQKQLTRPGFYAADGNSHKGQLTGHRG